MVIKSASNRKNLRSIVDDRVNLQDGIAKILFSDEKEYIVTWK